MSQAANEVCDSGDGHPGELSLQGPAKQALAQFHGQVYATGDIVTGGKTVYELGPRYVPPLRQLPAAPSDFVGRHTELAALDKAQALAWDNASATVVHIHGMPGAGKTALALHWAHQTADRFESHIYLDLRGASRRQAVAPADALFGLLCNLGMAATELPADEDHRAALFRSLVAGRQVLVVLDNAASFEQVAPLVPGDGGCLVLVTSRDHLVGLSARFGTISVDVPPLTAGDSRRLVARLLANDHHSAEDGAVAELAEFCARLPLAIRIATQGIAPGPLDSAAGSRLDMLTIGTDTSLAIRSAFDLSYENLDSAEQRAFRLLGLMPGPDFCVASFAALLDAPDSEALRMLRRLLAKHLVEPGSNGRFRMHDLLNEYAKERLGGEHGDEIDAAIQRLQNWFLASVRSAGTTLGPTMDRARVRAQATAHQLAWFEAERAGLVTMTRRASDRGDWEGTWQLADALHQFLRGGQHGRDNLQVHELGLAAARAARERHAEAVMLDQLAVIHCELGQFAEATREADAAFAIFTELGDGARAGWALITQSRIERGCGRHKDALRCARNALRLLRQESDRRGVGESLEKMAQAEWRLARYGAALRHARGSLNVHRTLANDPGQAADGPGRLGQLGGVLT